MSRYILAPAARQNLRAIQAYIAQDSSRLRVRFLPRSGRAVLDWLILPTLDMNERISLTSQCASGQYGPITSFIALRHILSKSCVLCTAHEISHPSCSTDPAPPRTGHATNRTKCNFTPTPDFLCFWPVAGRRHRPGNRHR